MSSYTDDANPYKSSLMRRAFRLGWAAAEQGVDREQARELVQAAEPTLNQQTTAAWWRGYNAQQGEE